MLEDTRQTMPAVTVSLVMATTATCPWGLPCVVVCRMYFVLFAEYAMFAECFCHGTQQRLLFTKFRDKYTRQTALH
jgi:hypothetical protein